MTLKNSSKKSVKLLGMTVICFQFNRIQETQESCKNGTQHPSWDIWLLVIWDAAAKIFLSQNSSEISSRSLGQGGHYLQFLLGIKSSPEGWQVSSSTAVRELLGSQVCPYPRSLLPVAACSRIPVGTVCVSSSSAEGRNGFTHARQSVHAHCSMLRLFVLISAACRTETKLIHDVQYFGLMLAP